MPDPTLSSAVFDWARIPARPTKAGPGSVFFFASHDLA
jgi:hypothetical protein